MAMGREASWPLVRGPRRLPVLSCHECRRPVLLWKGERDPSVDDPITCSTVVRLDGSAVEVDDVYGCCSPRLVILGDRALPGELINLDA